MAAIKSPTTIGQLTVYEFTNLMYMLNIGGGAETADAAKNRAQALQSLADRGLLRNGAQHQPLDAKP